MTSTDAQLNLPDVGLCDEDLFWEKVAEIGWGTKTTDYDQIKAKILRAWTPAFTASFRERKRELNDKLYKRLDPVITGVSDDGFMDLRDHIIGLGRETYEAVMKDPAVAQKIVDEHSYRESFSYALPYPPRKASQTWEEFLEEEKRQAEDYGEPLSSESELRRKFLHQTQGDWVYSNPKYYQAGAAGLVEGFERFQESEFCTDEISKEVSLALDLLRQVADGNVLALADNAKDYKNAVKRVRQYMKEVREDFLNRLAEHSEVLGHWPENFGHDVQKFSE